MPPAHPFFLMWRSRRAYFRRQSYLLYQRYVHVLVIVLGLFGVLLVERPALLAEPILHFWREPGSLAANAGWAGLWLALAATWARIHRGFIAGGALAAFSRSLPQAVRAAPLVDAAMLLFGLEVFLVPAGLAAWTVAGDAGGAGGWFPLRAALLAVLTVGVARWACAGNPRWNAPAVLAGFLVLAGVGHYGAIEPVPLALASVLLAAALARDMARPPAPVVIASSTGPALRLPGLACLVALQLTLLVRGQLHAALPRFALAAALQAACIWMIFGAGKLAEAAAFVKVGCWLVAAIMSGFFFVFWTARQPIEPFVRSLPYGLLRLAASELLLVLGATALIFCAAYAACLLQPGQGEAVAAQLLRHGAASLLPLALFGAPVIQRHQNGPLLKVVILVASFLLL
ncbi:hypothetical protein [Massilia yuzhufengensis]|uniref:Uncharacterized protein n=1 Tax=Massilia yuzhufengensis TaxID=1164594 RepID=A0A1I1J579_9BURK|nr:hypothetical protein [Massilia yuzhufengensis]SFC43152.1 hypothetical protein SAMN05216204_10672 [Massilia yuzhufengensis]